MQAKIEAVLKGHREAFDNSFGPAKLADLSEITRQLLKSLKAGKKILLCGNGGSAADAQHIAAEFIARFKQERQSLPAIALTTDSSILTAMANDYGFERVFARQVEGLGRKGDVLIGISTSGNSKNILEAVKQAKKSGLVTIGFAGRDGGKLARLVDYCYIAGSDQTPHIQEMHTTSLHAICEVIEEVLFGA
ncbi:MAG: D-sedoheptulose 7-phosphate isomerase [Candidatus Omnitrophota bacterium]|nr:D-sedoheptulose 7-phosphate isomerase [Candidatus Omnitrophota bacterium]